MITRASGVGNVCALTFDDGPNGRDTERLLEFLRNSRIRAVFCLVGDRVRDPGGAELVRTMVADGHLLASHSMSHADLSAWSRAVIEADLQSSLAAIREAAGNASLSVPYFRAPFGRWGESESVAADLGLRCLAVINTIDDWATQDVPTLTANLRSAMVPGELVLAHDGGGDRRSTVDAVMTVVRERLAQGWRFTLPR